MAELVNRILSGRGVVLLPDSADLRKAKYLYTYVQVLRFPNNEYLNAKWNPSKSYYANLVFLAEGIIQRTETLEFVHQSFITDIDSQHQQTYALICAYDGILDSFVNLGIALQLPPIQRDNRIKDFKHLYTGYDEIWVQCYSDTLIEVSIKSVPFDRCADEENNPPNPPPEPPPPPPEPIPPGTPAFETPYPLSPPYEGREDEQQPAPIDVPGEPIPPERTCTPTVVAFRVNFRDSTGVPQFTDASASVYGDVGEIRGEIEPGRTLIWLESYGLTSAGTCREELGEDVVFLLSNDRFDSVELL